MNCLNLNHLVQYFKVFLLVWCYWLFMALTDFFKGQEEKKEEKEKSEGQGKYVQSCALCGATGTEKKWAGQYWHKKCMRKARKSAKGMF
jgi:hypothetical protein